MIEIVIPTIGRASLQALLASLLTAAGPRPQRIVIVDDRADRARPLELGVAVWSDDIKIDVMAGAARGPAAARNRGWRACGAPWIAFLDDDVIVDAAWLAELAADIDACDEDVAATYGRVGVPLPLDRKPTDWERNVAGLETARFVTADCAFRRRALATLDGFDERFPRAFREDADLALRAIDAGWRLTTGRRWVVHPVRPTSPLASIGRQAGNADDVLMEELHGRDWYERAGAPRGAYGQHVVTVTLAIASLAFAAAWLTATLRFAWMRISPGPRSRAEIADVLVTSVVIPFAAVAHRARGHAALPRLVEQHRTVHRPRAVLFDRDGTLVEDVPYNGEPALVRPVRGARAALARLRAAGIAIGIVTNQSGIALGKITAAQVAAVHARLADLLGPFDTIAFCPHAPDDGCRCRKPAPGLIETAARALGLEPRDCVVIGDIGADVEAARAAGAGAILVPTPVTRPAEIAAAPHVERDLAGAVRTVLNGRA